MPDRSWIYWSVLSLSVLLAVYWLWTLTAHAYLKLFMDLAVIQFICLADLPQGATFLHPV